MTAATATSAAPAAGQDVDFIFKVVLIGDSGVGKTSLTERFVDNRFSTGVLSTIAVDFKVHIMTVDDKRVKIQIWDTAGAERFRSVARSFYRGANAVMLCYDVSDRGSFEHVATPWLDEVSRSVLPGTPCIAVACKCDVTPPRRAVSQSEGCELARQYDIGYIETSAKENTNVVDAFTYITRKAIHDSVSLCEHRLAAASTTSFSPVQLGQRNTSPQHEHTKQQKVRNCC